MPSICSNGTDNGGNDPTKKRKEVDCSKYKLSSNGKCGSNGGNSFCKAADPVCSHWGWCQKSGFSDGNWPNTEFSNNKIQESCRNRSGTNNDSDNSGSSGSAESTPDVKKLFNTPPPKDLYSNVKA